MNTIIAEDFTIENINPQIATIYTKNPDQPFTGFSANNLILDFGKKSKADILVCSFLFKSNVYRINNTSAGCGCTRPSFKDIDDTTQLVTVDFNSSKLTNNVNKWLTLYVNNNEKRIAINLLINKP